MPYIVAKKRRILEPVVSPSEHAGDLNFVISRLCNRYIKTNGMCYAVVNEVIGVLECAKLELYRRVAAPYEDKKIEENGDVFTI